MVRTNDLTRVAAVVMVASGAAGCLWADPFVAACEAALKDTLRSPSTYQRVATSRMQQDISLEEYFKGRSETSKALMDLMRREEVQPQRFSLLITYDAANAYGTPVREKSACTFDTTDSAPDGARDFSVRINGKTKNDRLIEAIRALERR